MNGKHELIGLNFSWLDDQRVAGCRGVRTPNDLKTLADQGIKALVRLAFESELEDAITGEDVKGGQLDDLYEPVRDFSAPTQDQIDRVIAFIAESLQNGKPVALSCNAGYGRTGTLLACYLVSTGLSAEDAISRVLAVRPDSKEMRPAQRQAVTEFARRFHPHD